KEYLFIFDLGEIDGKPAYAAQKTKKGKCVAVIGTEEVRSIRTLGDFGKIYKGRLRRNGKLVKVE
ncbi:MAG: hypothetical protein V3V78_04895, partial [Candidatus Woesearchaeota archaeon]